MKAYLIADHVKTNDRVVANGLREERVRDEIELNCHLGTPFGKGFLGTFCLTVLHMRGLITHMCRGVGRLEEKAGAPAPLPTDVSNALLNVFFFFEEKSFSKAFKTSCFSQS